MNRIMQLSVVSALLLNISIATITHAEFSEGKNSFQANLGFSHGGMGLGFDFEHAYERTYGVGGYVRIFPENDKVTNTQNGVTAAGAFIRPHFNRQAWDLYLSPGFGFVSLSPYTRGKSNETLLGPSFALGLLYEFNPSTSFGCELMDIYSWFGEDDYRGNVSEEFMAKLRFIF
jgi:hypothetical protein